MDSQTRESMLSRIEKILEDLKSITPNDPVQLDRCESNAGSEYAISCIKAYLAFYRERMRTPSKYAEFLHELENGTFYARLIDVLKSLQMEVSPSVHSGIKQGISMFLESASRKLS